MIFEKCNYDFEFHGVCFAFFECAWAACFPAGRLWKGEEREDISGH